MNKLIITAVLATVSIATVSVAPASAGVNGRIGHQQNRILNGVGTGKLTQKEFNRVENRDQAIRKEEKFMRAANGGKLTGFDRHVLNHQLDRSSKLIWKEKHN